MIIYDNFVVFAFSLYTLCTAVAITLFSIFVGLGPDAENKG